MENTLKFSVDSINEIEDESSEEFSYARIAVLSTKPNTHHIIITDEILRRDGLSILGKWVVCDFNGYDATTHTPQEKIVGIVPKDANVEFVEENDGTTTMYVDAIISKIYAKEIYDMFKVINFRNVSVEMLTSNDLELPNGDIQIDGLKIVGITILGQTVNGSCPNANMSIIKFAVDKAEQYYQQFSQVNKAKILAEQLIEFANELNQKPNKEEEMKEEDKKFSESTDKEEKDVVMEETEQVETDMAENSENVEEKEEFAEEDNSANENEEDSEKEMACGSKEEMSEPNEQEMSEEPKETEKEMSENLEELNIETFSLRKYSTFEYQEESEEIKEFADSVLDTMSANNIVSTILSLAKENSELKKFKEERLNVDKEIKINSIMNSVREDLGEKKFSELRNEGMSLSIEELDGFENKVKAFAYEASKGKEKKEDEGIMRFAGVEIKQQSEITADDIYKKYL